MPLSRRLLAEALGALLLATAVGSGIMGTDLPAGNDGIALLAIMTDRMIKAWQKRRGAATEVKA